MGVMYLLADFITKIRQKVIVTCQKPADFSVVSNSGKYI